METIPFCSVVNEKEQKKVDSICIAVFPADGIDRREKAIDSVQRLMLFERVQIE
jgi:hypothetical protein